MFVCSRVLNPSSGKGVWGDTFCVCVCLFVQGLLFYCFIPFVCVCVCLFEGFKPEFWKGGLGGHLLFVCVCVCVFVPGHY